MKSLIKLLAISSVLLLVGCVNMGEHASFSEGLKDNFLLTSAQTVSDSEARCVSVAHPIIFKAGDVTVTLPAGKYLGTRKNSTGYFYYAPSPISLSVSKWLVTPPQGIYINNAFTGGNLFGRSDTGFDDRPIRMTVLPSSIFASIHKC